MQPDWCEYSDICFHLDLILTSVFEYMCFCRFPSLHRCPTLRCSRWGWCIELFDIYNEIWIPDWNITFVHSVSMASPRFHLWLAVYLWPSFIWGGIKFPPCPSCPICVRCLALGCSGWPRTPAVERIPAAIASLFCTVCLVSKSLIIRVGVNGNAAVT